MAHPSPMATMGGSASRMSATLPSKLVVMIRRCASAVVSNTVPRWPSPALHTSTCTGPPISWEAWRTLSPNSSGDSAARSSGNTCTRAGAAQLEATASRRSARRAEMASLAPRVESSRARASPRPEEAPVRRTRLPCQNVDDPGQHRLVMMAALSHERMKNVTHCRSRWLSVVSKTQKFHMNTILEGKLEGLSRESVCVPAAQGARRRIAVETDCLVDHGVRVRLERARRRARDLLRRR